MEQTELKEVTQTESFWLWVMRKNKKEGIKGTRRHWQWGRYEFYYERRCKSNSWGRFGGGWNWKLGFQAGEKPSFSIFWFAPSELINAD